LAKDNSIDSLSVTGSIYRPVSTLGLLIKYVLNNDELDKLFQQLQFMVCPNL